MARQREMPIFSNYSGADDRKKYWPLVFPFEQLWRILRRQALHSCKKSWKSSPGAVLLCRQYNMILAACKTKTNEQKAPHAEQPHAGPAIPAGERRVNLSRAARGPAG